MRFDERVAIVTGAGGNPGLGRSYARLLAARGAKVVVNDLGVGPDGRGNVTAHADVVAQEIRDAGGEAIADTNSVAEESSARAIVQTALDAWGRLDVLVNNAGVFHLALFDELAPRDAERIVSVHLLGNIWMCRAAWPAMKAAGYGRIINVSSGAMLGGRYNVVYGAAKAGIYGLTRGLAVEGDPHGIKVNALGPGAHTAASDLLFESAEFPGVDPGDLDPDVVAPTVAFLAHQDCDVSGKFINSMAGRVSEMYLAETAGHRSAEATPEDVRDHFAAVVDRDGARAIPDPAVALPATLTPKAYVPEPEGEMQ
jgi:NAD(P)-dependent dehydrogenase (short-subunit alcohol dehydrogenase family)